MAVGVGLIANPVSSSDIRRVVAYASTVPNHEKVNMLRRVLLGLAATDVATVWFMPDALGLVQQAAQRLDLPFELVALEQPITGTARDTEHAMEQLAEREAACVITLGGDGTARAAAKGSRSVPLLALSTGTNNAFPIFVEPTLAGLAAGLFATSAPEALVWHPVLEVWKADSCVDLALVDVAAVADSLGGKAVWEVERLRQVITTRLEPGTVGLSALGGQIGGFAPTSAIAVALGIGGLGEQVRTPLAPGLIVDVPVHDIRWLHSMERVELPSGVALALDGERELMARANEHWSVRAIAHGIASVDVQQALAAGRHPNEIFDHA